MFKKEMNIDKGHFKYKEICINADNSDDIKLMKFLSKYRLPEINKLTICEINCEVEKIISLFIENSLPIPLPKLYMEWSSKEEFVCSLPASIPIAVSKVSGEVNLQSVTISKEDFEHLLFSCNSEEISFSFCLINLCSVPDLSSISKSNTANNDYIKRLNFSFTESNTRPDVRWFELLVEGISKSKGIKDSLDYIKLYDCYIKREEAQEVIRRFEMDGVVVDVRTQGREERM